LPFALGEPTQTDGELGTVALSAVKHFTLIRRWGASQLENRDLDDGPGYMKVSILFTGFQTN
jgi:hypothetical protein